MIYVNNEFREIEFKEKTIEIEITVTADFDDIDPAGDFDFGNAYRWDFLAATETPC